METLIVHPENKAQLNAVKQVLKAMKISFEKEDKPYNPEFVAKIKNQSKTLKRENLLR